jgi:hypothetical protein
VLCRHPISILSAVGDIFNGSQCAAFLKTWFANLGLYLLTEWPPVRGEFKFKPNCLIIFAALHL